MIQFSYHEEARACYIYAEVREHEDSKGVVGRTVVLSENPMVNADYREDGTLYGVEVLLPRVDKARR